MENGEESFFCWKRNEKNYGRIEISALETSFKDLERMWKMCIKLK